MKKVILISVLLAAISPLLYAQFSLGAKAGMTVSNYNVRVKSKASVSYKAGLSARYMVSKFGVETGVYLKEAGSAYMQASLPPQNNKGGMVCVSVKSKYIDIPLSLVYKYPIAEKVSLTLNAGGYVAFENGGICTIAHSMGTYAMDPFEGFDSRKLPTDQNFVPFTVKAAHKLDFGLVAGIGLEVSRFSINASYDLGVANVYDSYLPLTSDKNVRNRIFWIAAGYHFNL
ncbi:MAG: PorT family protein [Dysgonamonadaceae bacterium]|jgi:hypothetical protein|nr:PorT family protein [Dysgonamonadaceae bacterium]